MRITKKIRISEDEEYEKKVKIFEGTPLIFWEQVAVLGRDTGILYYYFTTTTTTSYSGVSKSKIYYYTLPIGRSLVVVLYLEYEYK